MLVITLEFGMYDVLLIICSYRIPTILNGTMIIE